MSLIDFRHSELFIHRISKIGIIINLNDTFHLVAIVFESELCFDGVNAFFLSI